MKAFSDLEQSKKLAKILPLESADMSYRPYREEGGIPDYESDLCPYRFASWCGFPCWSLAALLDVLDDIVVDDEGNEYSLIILKEEGMYYIYYHDRWEEIDDIETDCYYDLVDACYEMIIKLHEQKIL